MLAGSYKLSALGEDVELILGSMKAQDEINELRDCGGCSKKVLSKACNETSTIIHLANVQERNSP